MKPLPLCIVCDAGFLGAYDLYQCDPCENWVHIGCSVPLTINDHDYIFCKDCHDMDG